MATRVELRAGVCVRRVQRDDLVAHEVVARGNALGHRVADDAAGLHGGAGAPDVRGAGAAFLLNFEPDGAVGGVSRVSRYDAGGGGTYLVPGM